jgi:3-oxoacyl-[acyl-carrier protein] reductase
VSDEVLLVTGASSDIGRGLIQSLLMPHSDGRRFAGQIIAHGNSGVKKLEALRAEMHQVAEQLNIVCADLGSESGLSSMIDNIRLRHGFPTQIVHLAAAKLTLKRPVEFDWAMLAEDLEIQLRSISLILKAFLPAMVKSGRRCKVIFMLSSVTIGTPPKYMSQYTVGKYALLGYLRSLAAEYADKPISFNAVSPSMVNTQFLSGVPRKYVDQAAVAHPSGRNANVADVVPTIRFLLSSDSNYISGANLPITAGSIL